MGGIFHQAPPLPDAAMRAQRARDRLERIQTQAVREDAQGDALAGALSGGGVHRALEAEAAVLAHLTRRPLAHIIGPQRHRTQGVLILGQPCCDRGAGRAMDVREPCLSMPNMPLGMEIAEVGPGATAEAPLAHGIDLLLHFTLRRRVAGKTLFDGEPLRPGKRERCGMQLAMLAHRVFNDRLGPIIEELVRHPAKADNGVLAPR
jgi:hypothetical protein